MRKSISSWLACTFVVCCVEGFATSKRNSFVGINPLAFQTAVKSNTIRMDYENSFFDAATRMNLEKSLLLEIPSPKTIEAAEAQHGMPWTTSIDKNAFEDEELLYMPFWNWHMKFIKDNLTNVRVVSCSNGDTDFSYNENSAKKARIVNICLSSNEYRKIRMTYYDAGDNTQVYNAVCYPDPKYNLPVLGVDLLAFNRKKYLSIVDFQPLYDSEEDHAVLYEHHLKPVKEKYENMKGRMSSKFYDETKFFSQQMLFARFEDEKIISNELLPAFKEYVKIHLDLIRNVDENLDSVGAVLDRQKAYDTYSAERDPATGLFTAMFGNDWAQDFVHDFLFAMSERKDSSSTTATAPSFQPPTGVHAPQPPQQRTPSFVSNDRVNVLPSIRR